MKKIVIIGATSGIAQQCARLWAQESADFTLVGRDAARLEVLAADLRVRSPQSRVAVAALDFDDTAAVAALAKQLDDAAGGLDVVLVAHGSLPDQSACQANLAEAAQAIRVNALSPVLVAEAFAARMALRKAGTLAVIGSVAGDRGRKSNYTYGAAKALVATYLEGLQHRFAASGVKVVLIKPGPTDTPMTAHLTGGKLKLAPVEVVAAVIVRGIAAGSPVVYAPGKWRLIMLVIRHLPRFVFNKMDI